MSRIENNEVLPTLDLVSTICKSLGVSLQELLDFTESKIFNNINSKQKGGENITYNNTEIKQVQDLYEKLRAEKERTIEILQKQVE